MPEFLKVGTRLFRRFSTCVRENAHKNTVRHVMVCDVYCSFSKIL